MRAEGDGRVKNKLLIEDMMVKVKATTKLVQSPSLLSARLLVWRDTLPPAGWRLTLQFIRTPRQLNLEKTIGARILAGIRPEPRRWWKMSQGFSFPGQNRQSRDKLPNVDESH